MINVWFALGDNNQIIQIGKDCLFSASVILRTNDRHSVLDENHNRINYLKSITIGDRVWIGYGVNVLKGSCVGNDCVVGTQSLVTGGVFKDNSIIVGNPARMLNRTLVGIKDNYS